MNCIGELLEIGRPPAYKTKTEQYNLEEGEPWYQKAQKKNYVLQVRIELTTLRRGQVWML